MSVHWICTKCGCMTANSGAKPPVKWNRPCSGSKNGLHTWVKNGGTARK